MGGEQAKSQGRDLDAFGRLTSLYVLALSLVALLSIAGQLLIQMQLGRQAHDSRVVNIAGRQRMLSQRICKEVLAWQSSTESKQSEAHLAELRESFELWQTSHEGLLHGSEPLGLDVANSDKLKSMFVSLEEDYSTMLREVKQLFQLATQPSSPSTDALVEESVAVLLNHEDDYLNAMDAIVFQYDEEAAQRVRRLRNIELLLLCSTLLVLLAEGLLIFKPVTRKIRQTLAELERTTEKLKQAKLSAETANQHKSAFLANVSHDLRTPMNAIIGLTQLAKTTSDAEQRNQFLEKVSDSADSLLLLLNDLIDLSRIEAGKWELRPTIIDTAKFLERITTLLQPPALAKKLDFRIDCPPSFPMKFRADEVRLQQVLVNLLSNSIKFTETGYISLKLRYQSESTEPRLQFTVLDTGKGIARSDQQRVFESFTQLNSSPDPAQDGVGLGLAICAKLVREFGDQLHLISAPDEGTQISFSLPYSPLTESNGAISTKLPKLSSPAEFIRSLNGREVLVVEDTAVNQLVVGENLRRAGAEVTIAETGEEALRLTEQRLFDVVLMDLQLPDQSGLEVTRKLRSREQLRDVPIIALTAHAMLEDAERCYEAGMDGYLTKPLRAEKLLSMLSKSLSSRNPERQQEDLPDHQSNWCFQNVEPIVLQRLDGRSEVLQQLIELLLGELPKSIDELTQAAEQEDRHTIAVLAHRIKGMVSNLAADRAERLAQAVEATCQSATGINTVVDSVESLKQELSSILEELQQAVDLKC